MTFSDLTPVTTQQIIVAVCAIVGSSATVVTAIVAITRGATKAATEFKLGIDRVSEALTSLATAVEKGFERVDMRLDRGEGTMNRLDRRVLTLEIHNGINSSHTRAEDVQDNETPA